MANKIIRMSLPPKGDDEGTFRNEFRVGLFDARLDTLQGHVVSHRVVKKRLGF